MKLKWADVSFDSAECGISVPERGTTLNRSIFSLLVFVNHSLRYLFHPGYCRENLGPSVRFVILQAVNVYVLWLCVLGIVAVDMILCYYILQEQFFHPHPDGFYTTCSGLEGSS